MALTVTIRSLVLTSVTNLFTENDMNRYFKILATAVAAAGLLASCNRVDVTPDQPDLPGISKYEQLTFSSADEPSTRAMWSDEKGSGNLIFSWEEDNAGTEVVALLTGEDSFIPNYPSENPSADELNDIKYHTYMTISPQEDLHKADFKTVRYYDTEDMANAKAVFAVTPVNDFCIFEADETSFSAQMEMPASFVQSFSQTPEFLRDYMMMYGLGEFENGSASISFKHIPATFRFIITNKRPTTARLENVSLSIDGGASVGSNFAEVHGDYTTESLYVDFAGNHTSITTLLNTTLASQESYTAYAMALPLSDSETLEGKDIKFVINTEEHGFLSFVLTGSQIANANKSYGEDIYNWVGGKSYTIRMSLSDVLTFDGITVEDWNKETIDGGEAEEEMTWKNGINKLTGEYEAAQLNADDYYEINNAGNLFWFAQQVNEGGEAGRYLNAILKQDIDLEGRPWTPIGTTGGTTSQSFRGIFDGNGKTIRGLYVDAQRSGLGFFGEVRKGVVKDFTIYGDVFLNGKYNYIGGVIGSACGIQGENGSTISGITSYVNVTLGEGTHGSNHVAGLIGYVNHNTTVERCMWLGKLDLDIYRAQDGVGGLIGKANAQYVGTIRDCAAYGTIRTAYQSGSYVNPSDNQPFTNIFIGGIVSNSLAGATTNIENCIWAGNIVDETDLVENAHISAIGTLNGVGSVSNCYYYLGTVPYVTTHNAYDTTDKVFGAYLNQLMNGEIAAKLGDAWEQGEKYPILK